MSKKIVIASGGSGGHLIPAQLLAEQLRKSGATVRFGGFKLAIKSLLRSGAF